jgi:hypothetical protein
MTNNEFFSLVCAYLGLPVTPWRLKFFALWARYESDGRLLSMAFNPLATTQDRHGVATGSWNSVGVKIFANGNDGAQSTAETITNGYYPAIVKLLEQQNFAVDDPELRKNFTTWVGSDAYGLSLLQEASLIQDSKEPLVVESSIGLEDVLRLLNKSKAKEWLQDGDELLTGYEDLQIRIGKLELLTSQIQEALDLVRKLDNFFKTYN